MSLTEEVARLFAIRAAGGIRCTDPLCPWAVATDETDVELLTKTHAAEHDGGRRSHIQAARQAESSRALRHAGDRRLPEPTNDANGWRR